MNKLREKIQTIFLVLILLFFSSIISAQTVIIEVKSDSLFINSKKVTKETKVQELRSILGNPNREFDKLSTIWTYDSLGFKLYISNEDSSLESISLDFKKDNLEFSPQEVFSGKFIINNEEILAKTSTTDFEKMNIRFESSISDWYRTVVGWHDASTKYLRFVIDYSKDDKMLEVVEITFK